MDGEGGRRGGRVGAVRFTRRALRRGCEGVEAGWGVVDALIRPFFLDTTLGAMWEELVWGTRRLRWRRGVRHRQRWIERGTAEAVWTHSPRSPFSLTSTSLNAGCQEPPDVYRSPS